MNVAAGATEPRQSEEPPRQSDAKFRLLFEKSPNAMLLLDGDTIVDCNFFGPIAQFLAPHKSTDALSSTISHPKEVADALAVP